MLVACSKQSDSGEQCAVKKAMKSRGGLGREVREPPLSPLLLPCFYFFALLFTLHRSPLSERLEQAIMLVPHGTQRVNTLYEVLHQSHAIKSCFYHCNLQPAPPMELNF